MSRRLDTFTVCQPGLEPVTAAELTRQGITGRVTHGGVIASMTWPQLALAHLHLRTATRVLVRLGRFDASTFSELAAGLRRVDWATWLPSDAALEVRVSTSASKLYHTGAIEERVREVVRSGPGAPQRLSVRIDRDLVTLSLDASGDPLYQRGWRTEAVEAPMRETLAAALVLWSGWDGRSPLVDPCCGSGTIAIEAAMIAARRPPGRHRSFAWQKWPASTAVAWDKVLDAADADVRPTNVTVMAADLDAEATACTERNADRAGVSLTVVTAPVDTLTLPTRPGWIVTNPPYGGRVGRGRDLRPLYASIGQRAVAPWHLAVVAAQGTPTSAFDRLWVDSLTTRNGGMAVRFLRSA